MPTRNAGGFTMIEVIISVLLFVVAAAGIVKLMIVANGMTMRPDDHEAALVAQTVAEQVLANETYGHWSDPASMIFPGEDKGAVNWTVGGQLYTTNYSVRDVTPARDYRVTLVSVTCADPTYS